jgi:hypothetical protein
LLILNISKKDAIKFGNKFNQWAIIYCEKETINLICTNDNCVQYTNSCISCIYKTLNSEKEFNDLYSKLKKYKKLI